MITIKKKNLIVKQGFNVHTRKNISHAWERKWSYWLALKECFLPFPVSLRNLDFAHVV